MRVRDAIRAAAERLGGVSETSRLDAELIAAHALGTSRETMLLSRLDDPAPADFADLLARRLACEPVAYITGTRDFWTITLDVTPDVLIPRADSETLIEAAIEHFGSGPGPRSILDLGTGSGVLLLAALDQWPQARGIGLDKSQAAVRVARANVRKLGLRARARITTGDWFGSGGPHDLILCNPPYIETGETLPRDVGDWEPASALFAGPDGMDDYLMIAPVLYPQLAPGGVACIEIGSTQAAAVRGLFADAGFDVKVRQDLAGRDRCLVLNRRADDPNLCST